MKDLDDRDLDDAMKQVRGTWRPWLLLVLTLAIAGYGGYHFHRRSEAAEKVVAEVDERIAEKVAQIAVLEQAKKELERRIERVDRENRDLTALKTLEEQKKKEQAEKRVRLETLKTRISEALAKEIGGGTVQLQTGDQLDIQLTDKALFDGAEPTISAGGQLVLLSIGGVLTSTKGIALEIAAHSDEIPTAWEVSSARAAAVARFFAEKVRFKAEKMTAIGFGASRPIAPNKTAAGRAKNRRISLAATISDD